MKGALSIFRNRNIALLIVGRLVSTSGDWVYAIGLMLAIYQFSRGNTFLIGLFWVGRFVPSLVLGPFAGALADRMGYRRAMITADLARTVFVTALAFLLGPSTWGLIYPIAVLVVAGNSLFNPSSIGLVPRLVESSAERLRANATIMQAGALAVIIGSAAGGFAAGIGYRQLLLIDAATFLVSALCLTFVRPRPLQEPATSRTEEVTEGTSGNTFIAAFRLLASRPILVFIAIVMAMPEIASGATPVWAVPYTQHVLHLQASGAGYIYTALGVGCLVGGMVAAAVGSSIRLDMLLAGSVAVGGIALVLLGTVPIALVALLLLAIRGICETVEYAAYETLLQQAVPGSMIGRAAGTMDSFLFNMVLVGNVVTAFFLSLLGLQRFIAGFGLLIIFATVSAWWYLRVRTAGQPNALALEAVPAFRTVPLDVREWAVRRMQRFDFAPGAVVIRQGDVGDLFYTIARGRVDVEVASNGTVTHHTMGPGEFFGEIALLQDVPRTATVRAETDLIVWGLTREDFDELQARADQFRESLAETAATRMAQSPNVAVPLTSRA